MSSYEDDGLWPYFVPLWRGIRSVSSEVVLAGGYGLFLKHNWLLSLEGELADHQGNQLVGDRGDAFQVNVEPTLIEIQHWSQLEPRATKDFDFIVSIDLIASEQAQRRVAKVLREHEFQVVPENAKWQFRRNIGSDQGILVDFHSPDPAGKAQAVRVKSRRVMPPKPLGAHSIHGRLNPESGGSNEEQFDFDYRGEKIAIPNPVNFAAMKMVAARDRRQASEDASRPPDERSFSFREAQKHAADLFRVVAMMTRRENERAPRVAEALRGTPAFQEAKKVYSEHFAKAGQWADEIAQLEGWKAEDLEMIRSVLKDWFGPASPA